MQNLANYCLGFARNTEGCQPLNVVGSSAKVAIGSYVQKRVLV